MPHTSPSFTVDVFCRVIDNFGDAGVCLRLARQLVIEYGCAVRLFCDDTALLARLDPAPPAGLHYEAWHAQQVARPAQGVISGFGCDLEAAYLQAMCAANTPPRWLHLDYLSAEDWVEGTHGLDSQHPRLGLVQRFCYPGFTDSTGGLLREFDCMPAWSEAQSLSTLARYGITPAADALRVLIFAYDYADFAPLIAASQSHPQALHWLICQGSAGDALAKALSQAGVQGDAMSRLPFVPQGEFDALLRSAHRAWVRGEDSAIRALWAGVPSVWQFYAQPEDVHLTKMQAYLQRMAAALPAQELNVIHVVHHAANGALPHAQAQTAWVEWLKSGDELRSLALGWRGHLAGKVPSLAFSVASYLIA